MIETLLARLLVPDWAKGIASLAVKAVAASAVAFGAYNALLWHGGNKREAKIERKDRANVSKANSAGTLSRTGTGGVRDPHVRND